MKYIPLPGPSQSQARSPADGTNKKKWAMDEGNLKNKDTTNYKS